MNMGDFIKKHDVRMACEWEHERPDYLMDDMPRGSNHYRCTISANGHRYTMHWSQGPAITDEPDAADVLDALASDASNTEAGFENFAAEYGYDEDSRKAERIYRACVGVRKALFRLFGDDAEALMYEVERL